MAGLKFFLLSLILLGGVVNAQSIIINEIYNSSANDEWVELLVIEDALDLRNWSIRDFNSSGAAQLPLVFSNHALWSNLKKGTIIVVARAENTFPEDTDPSDYTLTIKSNNGVYFSGPVFSIAGASEAIQIRNSSQTHIFGVSWGASNANSLPAPKVHFSGSSSSNTSIYFNEDSVEELTVTTNWTVNGVQSRGLGNTQTNINWINSLRARAEGSGFISMTPTTAQGGAIINLVFNYKRNPLYAINTLRVIIPSTFSWSQSLSSVAIANFTANSVVSGDTVTFTNVNFSNDSVLVTVNNVTAPLFTGNYKFKFQSGIGNIIDDVNPTPSMTVYGAAIPIAEAKENDENGIGLHLGNLVTIRGIVTVANQFGSPSYIQDNSAGISIYSPVFSASINLGDELIITGTITQFNGLNQLEFPQINSLVSTGNIVEPIEATPTHLQNDGVGGVENFEGRLVRLNGVIVRELNGSAIANWAYKNYLLVGAHPGDTVQVRIDNDTQIIGMVAPAGRFDIVGVLSQFKTTVPYIGGYQLMPRIPADIISTGPIIEKFPEEIDLTSNSITLEWHTINPGTSRIRYGTTTNYELGVIQPDNTLRTEHVVTVAGLNTATIYNLQAFSVSNNDTSFSSNIISSTTSAFPTTGEINVYFNKTVFPGVSSGTVANSNIDFRTKLIERINNAKRSIDVALYSLSGTTGANIATALVNAKNRGVKVRVVGEYDTRTTVPWTTLTNNGIPYINDQFGNNAGSGLHHNKFFVIDFRGGAHDSVWMITGSWNPTDPGTNDDRQNIVEIQDVALAGAYTVEFEEMWGSNTETPNAQNSRFGSRKQNNTPHTFIIGGVKVESYFSPSDRTTYQIGKKIHEAEGSVNGAIMTFTRRDLADSVIAAKGRGKKTRLIFSNNSDTGTQFAYLQSAGVDIRLRGFTQGLLHHKYAIIDAEPYGLTGKVITGSHNWSSAAENSNDENTLIIHGTRIANEYLQEFAARYYEAGGTDSIIVIVSMDDMLEIPVDFTLYQNYPNPFNPTTTIKAAIPFTQKVDLKLYDVLGREVITLFSGIAEAGMLTIKFDASELASGMYIYQLKSTDFIATKKLLLLK